MTELYENLIDALDGRLDADYVGTRFATANREAVSTHDGTRISLTDSTGLQLSGTPEQVAVALANHYVATAPDAMRTGSESKRQESIEWDRLRDAARARQDAKAGGVTEAARKKLEAL